MYSTQTHTRECSLYEHNALLSNENVLTIFHFSIELNLWTKIFSITCSYANDELGSGYWEDVAHNLEYQSFEDPLEYQENLEYQNIGENNFFFVHCGQMHYGTIRGISPPTFIALWTLTFGSEAF